MELLKLQSRQQVGSTLTTQTKKDIVDRLKEYNVGSITPQIVDPEVTSILLTCNAKFDAASTTKDAETLKSDIITNLQITIQTHYKNLIVYSDILK